MQIVFVYHFLRYIWQFNLCVLWPFQWSHELKIGEICACKLGSLHRYDAVQKYFDEQQVGCWGTNIVRIVDEVPCHCGSGSIWILLLGSDIANKLDVSHIFQSVRRNLPFVDETNCVSAFYSASNALS